MAHVSGLLLLILCPLLLAGAGPQEEGRTVLFFGNSLTAGYGVDPSESFPALIQERVDSLGWNWRVVNAGLSGETSAGGLRRIDWVLRQPVDVFVLELGANDGLRGIQVADTRRNLSAILARVTEKYPGVVLVIAGMEVPPNLGDAYAGEFRRMFPVLADMHKAALIPFLLEGVGGRPELNLGDGIHPSPAGHRIVAETVWQILEPLFRSESGG